MRLSLINSLLSSLLEYVSSLGTQKQRRRRRRQSTVCHAANRMILSSFHGGLTCFLLNAGVWTSDFTASVANPGKRQTEEEKERGVAVMGGGMELWRRPQTRGQLDVEELDLWPPVKAGWCRRPKPLKSGAVCLYVYLSSICNQCYTEKPTFLQSFWGSLPSHLPPLTPRWRSLCQSSLMQSKVKQHHKSQLEHSENADSSKVAHFWLVLSK